MTGYWLMKTEPECFSIDDLYRAKDQITSWDGVRNYQARNYMQQQMIIHDPIFIYHSNCKPPSIVGVAEVWSKAYPDYTAFDPENEHYDPKSTPEKPRWFMVDVRFKEKFKTPISLETLKHFPELKQMKLLQKGNRLSVLPVLKEEWTFIYNLATEQ